MHAGRVGFIAMLFVLPAIPAPAQQGKPAATTERVVLVELYTSQGCDMCPEAERILGALGERNPGVVPVALHVDYFNEPWHDPYSDPRHSDRQATYNTLYDRPKNGEYGLYYTPMVMVDGVETVNGRDPAGLESTVRQAQGRPPAVSIVPRLKLAADRRSGSLEVAIAALSPQVVGRDLVVGAIVRDDGAKTRVRSGENAGKTLTARFPARLTSYEFTRLANQKEVSVPFKLRLNAQWPLERLAVVVFVQDQKTGEIYQAAVVPWDRPAADRNAGEPPPAR